MFITPILFSATPASPPARRHTRFGGGLQFPSPRANIEDVPYRTLELYTGPRGENAGSYVDSYDAYKVAPISHALDMSGFGPCAGLAVINKEGHGDQHMAVHVFTMLPPEKLATVLRQTIDCTQSDLYILPGRSRKHTGHTVQTILTALDMVQAGLSKRAVFIKYPDTAISPRLTLYNRGIWYTDQRKDISILGTNQFPMDWELIPGGMATKGPKEKHAEMVAIHQRGVDRLMAAILSWPNDGLPPDEDPLD